MECRKSGLSDYQWCKQKGIKPGTFYNWYNWQHCSFEEKKLFAINYKKYSHLQLFCGKINKKLFAKELILDDQERKTREKEK